MPTRRFPRRPIAPLSTRSPISPWQCVGAALFCRVNERPRGEDSVRGTFTKSMRNCVLVATMLATLAACDTPPKDARPPKSPDQVMLTEGDIANRPYQIIKDID